MKPIMKITSALALACTLASVSQASIVYDLPGSGLPVAIPDNTPAGITTTFTMPLAPGPITDIWLDMSISHTWVGDLIATLTSPGGASFTLFSRVGAIVPGLFGDNSNLDGLYRFIDSGANFWTAAAAGESAYVIPGGDYLPSAALTDTPTSWAADSGFIGLSPAQSVGDWVLRISDNAAADLGTLSAANLYIVAVPEPGQIAMMVLAGVGALGYAGRNWRRRRQQG